MSLHPQPMTPVPEQTARVAHAAFPKGHPYPVIPPEPPRPVITGAAILAFRKDQCENTP
jgi:hypothetical protein